MNSQTDELSSTEERKILSSLLNPILFIYKNDRNCPVKLILACQCLSNLVSKEIDKSNRYILVQGDIVNVISSYVTHYDKTLVNNSLELLINLLPATRNKIADYLYSRKDFSLLKRLTGLLSRSNIAGDFTSVKVAVNVIVIFLTLTGIHESNFKEHLNTQEWSYIYRQLLDLIDEEKRKEIIDVAEETSYILEHKIFWLLNLLLHKNRRGKEIFAEMIDVKEFILDKCRFYYGLVEIILHGTDNMQEVKFSETRNRAILKTVKKFFEFVYWQIFSSEDLKNELKGNENYFYKLLQTIRANKSNLYSESENDVFVWIPAKMNEYNN